MRNRLAGTLLLLFVFLCTSWAQTSGLRKMIDLSGTWSFALDPYDKGEQEKLWNMDFAETVTLPGTTDSNRKGIELSLIHICWREICRELSDPETVGNAGRKMDTSGTCGNYE